MGSKVTLGIPLHNSAPFLDELFTCLRGLDPAPAEIIFLDDASNDDSAARVDGFLASGAVAGVVAGPLGPAPPAHPVTVDVRYRSGTR